MKRRWCGALVGLAALAACSDDAVKDRYAGVVAYGDFPTTARGEDRSEDLGYAAAFVLSAAFVGGQAVQYLDLGEFSPAVPKMYVLVREGAAVPGQYPIIDTLPDKADYSPWWQVVEVEVPASYVANDIKSVASLEKAGYAQTAKLEAVHCPIVNPDAAWFAAAPSQTYTVFWGTGEAIPNPYYDPSAPAGEDNPPVLHDEDATDGDIVLQPVWHKRLRAFCWSEDFSARHPVVDDEGVAYLDTDAIGGRYDAYLLEWSVGGELAPAPAPTFPVFEALPGDEGYAAAVVAYAAFASSADQAGGVEDLDLEGAEPLALVDNPIVFPLTLDRFEVTFSNTTLAADGLTLSAGAANVSDGSGAYFELDAPASGALAALSLGGDPAGLLAGYPVTARFLDVILDARAVPALAAGETASFVVLAHPYYPFLSTAHAVLGLDDAFTGVAALALYDEDFAPIDTVDEGLVIFTTASDVEDGVVGDHPVRAAAVGTLSTTLLTGGAP